MALALLKLSRDSVAASHGRVLSRQQVRQLTTLSQWRDEVGSDLQRFRKQVENVAIQGYKEQIALTRRQSVSELEREVGRLNQEIQRFKERVSDKFVETVLECVRAVVGARLPTEYFIQAVRAAEAYLESETRIVMRVAPADSAAAAAAIAELTKRGGRSIPLVEDATLPPGACTVVTPIGSIDSSLDVQLEALRKELEHWQHLQSRSAQRPDGQAPSQEPAVVPVDVESIGAEDRRSHDEDGRR
jgi:type III secretion protein L